MSHKDTSKIMNAYASAGKSQGPASGEESLPLAAALVHEIGNVLTPASAYIQLALQNTSDTELTGTALEKAASAIEAVSLLTQSMLGRMPAEAPKTCDLKRVISHVLDSVQVRQNAASLRMSSRIEGPSVVCMPEHVLQQILLNLAFNAAKAMGTSGGAIDITSVAKSSGQCLIRVRDTGPGLPGDLVDAFDSAPQLEVSPISPCAVHGLGLPIVRHLVMQYGGTIEVESSSDDGTVIAIGIPLASVESAQAG